MSALAMILTAAMVVPGDGLEKVSGEMVQGLDLSGKWEGVWMENPNGETAPFGYKDGSIYFSARTHFPAKIVDDGKGRLHFTQGWEGYIGIYQQDRSRLTICYCDKRYGRPTSFRIGDGKHQLIILHRVKPRK